MVTWFAVIGILSFAVGRGLTFLGIRHIGAARATTLYGTHPLFVMALAILLLGERVSVALVIGVMLIIGGITVLLFDREADKRLLPGANRVMDYVLSLVSAISYGCNAVIIKWVVSGMAHPMVTVTFSLIFGALALSVFGGRDVVSSIKNNWRATGYLILSGVASTVGAMAIYIALSMAPAVMVSPLGATSPLFTLLGTYLFMRRLEKVTYHVVLGCFMVVAGGILVTTA